MGLLECEMEGNNELRIQSGDVEGVYWELTMVKGLVTGEQGE